MLAEAAPQLRLLAKTGKPDAFLQVLKDLAMPALLELRSARRRKRKHADEDDALPPKNKLTRTLPAASHPASELEGPPDTIVEAVEVPWLLDPETAGTSGLPKIHSPMPAPPVGPVEDLLAEFGVAGDSWFQKRLRDLVQEPDQLQRSTGHIAAHAGNEEILRLLLAPLSDGQPLWNVHSTAQGGWKGVHFAASKGHVGCVELFLKAGVRVNTATFRGQKTPVGPSPRDC